MKEYLFYIEGLNREVWQKGVNQSAAHTLLWQSLSSEDRDAVVQMDCIDQRPSDTPEHSPVDNSQHTPQQQAWAAIEQALAERDKLKAINTDLLTALQGIYDDCDGLNRCLAPTMASINRARKALAKAKGG